jgi:hypothetical protein
MVVEISGILENQKHLEIRVREPTPIYGERILSSMHTRLEEYTSLGKYWKERLGLL